MRRVSFAAIALLCACSADAIEVRSRAFQHPSAVTFACYDLAPEGGGAIAAVPLSSCNAADNTRFRLHALVIQSSRGEVAAVDLDQSAVLDSDIRVPGYTFVPVGEIPVDLAVADSAPEHTYVADYGSMDIRRVDTARFHPRSAAADSTVADTVTLSGAPTDLVIGPEDQKLYATIPSLGAIAQVPLPFGSSPVATLVMLGTDVPPGVAATPEPTPYCRVCPSDYATPGDASDVVPCRDMLDPYPVVGEIRQPFPPRDPPDSIGTAAPEPVHAILDPEGRLLVADRALPIIHVLDVATDPPTPLTSIFTGVPTERLALTPPVPATVGDPIATEQFLYAIDATDGSVLAIRYDAATPSASAVLPVSVRGEADRIQLRAPARVLQVITPGYPALGQLAAGEGIALCDPDPAAGQAEAAQPLRLRGVFLAAGLLDGTVAIVDVHDLDAPCRGGDMCQSPARTDDRNVFIQRHRPRIGAFVTTAITLVSAPTLTANDVATPVGADGGTEGSLAPDLIDVALAEARCPQGMTRTYPFGDEAERALVCVLADPWAAESETWAATWQGTIPGTEGGRARLAPDSPTVTVEVDVCARGVLGQENIGALFPDLPEARYQPDLFVVTGAIPPGKEDDDTCRGLLDPSGELAFLDFPIVSAKRVTTPEGDESQLDLADATRGGIPYADVARCFDELTGYAIRAQGAFTVLGSRTGYPHRVVVDETDVDATTRLCIVDESLPATRTGRAIPGQLFDNAIVRFHLEDTDLARLDTVQLSFQVAQTPAELVISIGNELPTVLSDVAYNPVDGNVYVVDTSFAGLVQLTLDPVRTGVSFE